VTNSMASQSAARGREWQDDQLGTRQDHVETSNELLSDDSDAGVNFAVVLAALYRNRYIIAATVTLALLAGLTVTLLTTAIYKATSTVQIDLRSDNILASTSVEPDVAVADTNRFLQTQVTVLKSRSLAQRVARSLNLARDDRFIVEMGAQPRELPGKALPAVREAQVVGLLTRALTVDMPGNSRVMSITYASPSRLLAARVANSYADSYIRSNLERRVESSSYAREFLQRQIAETKERLQASEEALLDYQRSENLIDASPAQESNSSPGSTPGDGASLSVSNMVSLNTASSAATARRIEAEERWRQAERTPAMALPEVINSTLIQTLLAQKATQMIALEQLRARYRNGHPSVSQAEEQITSIDREINNQASNIRRGIEGNYQTLRMQEAALAANVGSLRLTALNEQGRRVKYNILKREVDTNRALYDALLQRYKEVAAAAGIATNNLSVIDLAQVPGRPSSPNLIRNMLIALVAGIGLAAVLVFVREQFDDVIRTPDDARRKLGLPLLGVIPQADNTNPKDEFGDPKSPVSEAYHSFRTALGFSTQSGAPRSLLFTSSRPGEGKSTSAVALAQGFGRIGRRVLLIDGDLRKPSLHRQLELTSRVGLANLLTAQNSIAEVVQHSAMENVDFVATGPLPPNPTELLTSDSLARTVSSALATYDLVIIDGPPVLGLADAQLLARQVEGVAFVIETGRAHRGQAKAAVRRLLSAEAIIVGVLLTKFNARRSGYGYGYGYEYNYDYSYGNDKVTTVT
jgi:succinoglycan biosynthesis transport protein ExoP